MENQMSMATVMVVQAPGRAEADLRGLRDYILESLNRGVLVLGAGMSYQLEKFPELGAVRITSEDVLRGNQELLRRAAPTGTGSGRLKKVRRRSEPPRARRKRPFWPGSRSTDRLTGWGALRCWPRKPGNCPRKRCFRW